MSKQVSVRLEIGALSYMIFKLKQNDCDKPAAVKFELLHFESSWQRWQTNSNYDNMIMIRCVCHMQPKHFKYELNTFKIATACLAMLMTILLCIPIVLIKASV